METLTIIQEAVEDELVIKVPESWRGKNLQVTIQEYADLGDESDETGYERRLREFRKIQLQKPTTYQPSEDEWYQQ